ncbi:MAG TPA: hypothetical protein VFA60_08745 [Terriglobales bacterium]|nr:hypothetical protein [Terriglobales bacterium]
MVTVTCDVCRAKRTSGEEWVLGYDLQAETPTSVQRAIRFLDRWDDRRILDLGAIHLCSERCRERYIKGARAA